jgi:hypothetical protein
MEIIPGLTISVSLIVGIMVKISMILLFVLSLVMVRQESLMNGVVDLPIGGNLKMFTWGFSAAILLLTAIVILG